MVWRILDSFIEFRATDSIGHASWFVLFFIVLFLIVIRTCSFRARQRIIWSRPRGRPRPRARLWWRVW